MIRSVLFITAFLISLPLFACSGDYKLCKQKFDDAHVAQHDGSLRIPIGHGRDLIYSERPLQIQALTTNAYLGLYLVATSKPFPHPFTLTKERSRKIVALDGVMALPGRIIQMQNGLNELGRFEHPLADAALLTDACCDLEGVATHRGLVDHHYLQHTLKSRGSVVYGDAGIRVVQQGRSLKVESIDPFIGFNPFLLGDEIIAIDGKAPQNLAALMRRISLAAPGTKCQISIKRSGQRHNFDITLQKRYGGGLLSDTYLERLGIFFDRDMNVIALSEDAKGWGIAVGDKLLQVNTEIVSFDDEVRRALGMQEEKASLLVERDGFQFFVQLPFRKL